MNVLYDIRRERLRKFMTDECDGKQSELADKLGKPPSYITRIFNNKNRKKIGEELAREIEELIKKPPYWLDGVEINPKWPFLNVDIGRVQSLSLKQKEAVGKSLDGILSIIEGQEVKELGSEIRMNAN